MQKVTYYPSTSKRFVVGSGWEAWNKFSIRKTSASRSFTKKVAGIYKENSKNSDFRGKFRKNSTHVIDCERQFFSVKDFQGRIFGEQKLGLSVRPVVASERKKSQSFKSNCFESAPKSCGSISPKTSLRFKRKSSL
jgi:hypothetical protein